MERSFETDLSCEVPTSIVATFGPNQWLVVVLWVCMALSIIFLWCVAWMY